MNHRLLVLKIDAGAWPELRRPRLAGISLDQAPGEAGSTLVALRLMESEHLGPFRTLCDDIIDEVSKAADAATARDKFIARTQSWQDLMRRALSPLLSPEAQMGVIGELVTLRDLIAPAIGAAAAVSAWTGPTRTPKDFEVGTVWIEGKAFGAAGRRQVRITSEVQLDDDGGDALFLNVTPLRANAPASLGGLTLSEWIFTVRTDLGREDASCFREFDEAVAALGFDPHHEYDMTWSAASPSLYRVAGRFPRIVPGQYPLGPANVSYDLPLSAIEGWRVPERDVADALRSSRTHPGETT